VIKYLLDTNILSEATKPEPNGHLMSMLEKHQYEIATGSPIWHELRYGCLRLPDSRKREMIETYLEEVIWQNMDILPYDERAAEWHAQERARLTRKGLVPAFVDGQIAAIAKVNGLILVTRNTSNFENFVDLPVENWFDV
jgi:tRNA(fMet)-specific endonuclease VapC